MKAAILEQYGDTPRYGDFEEPVADDGGEIAEVLAAALNPSDLTRALGPGKFFIAPPPVPYVVGREGVVRLRDGRRMYFGNVQGRYGACAERCAVDVGSLVELPDALDEALAAALGTSGAGWLALEWRAQLARGETVVILGATGTVGEIAIQAARLMGARRVVAVGRNAERLERALARGAHATVRLDAVDDLGQAVAEACEGGYDVLLDPLWGEPLARVLPAASPGARIVQIGQSADPAATLPSGPIRGKMLSILGYTSFNRLVPTTRRQASFAKMLEHAAAGRLAVEVERVPLPEAPGAWERQRESPGAKLVITP